MAALCVGRNAVLTGPDLVYTTDLMFKWMLITCLLGCVINTIMAQKQFEQPEVVPPDSLAARATALLKAKKLQEGKDLFLQLIYTARREGNRKQEAAWWKLLSDELPEADTSATGKIASLQRSLAVYTSLNERMQEKDLLYELARLHIRQGNMDAADTLTRRLLQLQESLGIKEKQNTYDHLVVVSRSKGNQSQAMYFAMEAIKCAEAARDTANLSRFYGRLAFIYKDLNEHDKALYWNKKTMDRYRRNGVKNKLFMYGATLGMLSTLIALHEPQAALDTAQTVLAQFPPVSPDEKQHAATMLGECYEALGQDKLAEQYFQEAVSWEEKHPHGFTMRFRTVYNMGKFYCDQRQYERARHYLLQAAQTEGFVAHSVQRNVQWLLFRVDSAAGNYLAAIGHYQRFKSISDTVYNIERSRQIEEMQAKYESGQKEQAIQLLRRESQLQQNELKQASQARTVTIAIIILLIIIIALLYNRYSIRQRNNLQLESQQKEINLKNASLQKLLEEKEWLLKEIHHRVNNNLQIVTSLLNTQSAYLDNDKAILAIRDSQHRMRAMSLIHQKLYQSEKVAAIDIQTYIQELISYLDDNFIVNNRIRFVLNLIPIELDVAQAVPLGLILNETITNAIKYAFPDNRPGVITITMEQPETGEIQLTIQDNGRGLPPGFDINGSHSLGMNLVQGLTQQLNGHFSMESREGVKATIRFPMTIYQDTILLPRAG